MANKTVQTKASVAEFLRQIADPAKRKDCRKIARIMRAATGKNARMWGDSLVGYGAYDYQYASGRAGTFFLTGFSPRARNIVIYIMPGFTHYGSLMQQLGKFKTGKSCLYLKSLSDVDENLLAELIEQSVRDMREKYKTT